MTNILKNTALIEVNKYFLLAVGDLLNHNTNNIINMGLVNTLPYISC